MSTPLMTDWITIGTSGPTIDGRNISPEMLTEMAESYDCEEYTAVINSDHMLFFFGNFGEVKELATGTDKKGRLALQARIRPNRRLMQMNAEGQRLFTSMEVDPNFLDSGKSYLVGLAVTDEPASIGTTELQFSRNKAGRPLTSFPVDLSFDGLNPYRTNRMNCADKASGNESFIRNLLQRLGMEQNRIDATNDEEDPMNDEQFNELKSLHEQHLVSIEKLTDELKQSSTSGLDDDKLNEIKEFMSSMSEQMKTFESKINHAVSENSGTKVPMNTGANDSGDFV